jgi:hypothetical protein
VPGQKIKGAGADMFENKRCLKIKGAGADMFDMFANAG